MNLLSINDLSKDQMNEIFEIADDIASGKSTTSLKEGSVLALLFEKPSTRTRVSFSVAMARLGGQAVYIDSKASQHSRGETWEDTARSLSLYVDFILARLDKHSDLVKISDNSVVPVINALTDLEHPTQALSDIYTIRGVKKKVKGIKIAFVGDISTNTANSLMLAAVKLGAQMALVGPKNYEPNAEYLAKAREYGVVDVYDNLEDGLSEADVVYTDTFKSFTDTFSKQFSDADVERTKKMFAKFQINDKVLPLADKAAVVMHPLPAFRGEEITEEVLEGPQSIVWKQAKNKLLIAEAVLIYLSEKTL